MSVNVKYSPEYEDTALVAAKFDASNTLKKVEERRDVSEVRKEIFRNKVTAVEVVVKAVPRRLSSKPEGVISSVAHAHYADHDLREDLRRRLEASEAATEGLRRVVSELKSQFILADRREMEAKSQALLLKLENEKLKVFLEAKTNRISKMKKDLSNLVRLTKYAVKDIWDTPKASVIEGCSERGLGYTKRSLCAHEVTKDDETFDQQSEVTKDDETFDQQSDNKYFCDKVESRGSYTVLSNYEKI